MRSGYFQHPRSEVTETRLKYLPEVGLQIAEIRVCVTQFCRLAGLPCKAAYALRK
ncbi:hypothetical protein GGP46_003265 [Salinibacter ruber]|nr:hypothetical protein [Salinibacter ruber]